MTENSKRRHLSYLSLSTKVFYILITLYFLVNGLYALKKATPIQKYIHDLWTTRHGLPQDTIYAIAQDKHGYIWLGTDKGVSRFNGDYFMTFSSSNTEGIRHDRISSLLISSKGDLWIGTQGGGVSLYKDGQFINYSTEDGLSSEVILCICEDVNQKIWLGTLGGGLICYKDSKFFSFNKSHGLSSDIVQSLLCDRRGNLWIGCDNGLIRFRNGTFKIYSTEHGLVDNNIRSIHEDSRGDLWVGTDNGISKIRKKSFVKWSNKQVTNLTTKSGLNDNCINAILEDKDGIIWVATSAGLNRIIKNKIEYYRHRVGLSDLPLLSIYQDKWGYLWVGSWGGGLSLLKDQSFFLYTKEDGLSREAITAVYEDQESVLWVGTQGGGVNRIVEGDIKTFTKRDGLWSNNINSLGSDSYGNVWVGTSKGLNRIIGEAISTYAGEKGIPRTSIDAIFEDSNKNLWIGTRGQGLIIYRDESAFILNRSHGLTSNFISAIGEDSLNNIWIGSQGGLIRIILLKDLDITQLVEKRAKVIDFFKVGVLTKKDGFEARHITDIYPDDEGALWLGTLESGLIRFKKDHFTLFGTESSFLNRIIYRIMEDDKNRLWISTNQGVFSVAKRVLNNFASGKRDHLHDGHFQEKALFKSLGCTGGFQPSGWQDHNGNMLFPTRKGLASINPKKKWFKIKKDPLNKITNKERLNHNLAIQKVIVERPVVIERLKANGSSVDLNNNQEFPPGTDSLEFYFTVVNFSTSKEILYSSRLKGYDEKWSTLRGTGRILYENLGPGSYTFEVTAQNSDGSWSQMGDSYSFSIKPGFFQTLWFPLLLVIIIIGGIKLIIFLFRGKGVNKETYAKRYMSLKLTPGRSRILIKRIIAIMDEKEPYLDPHLSLHKLSQMLGESKENVSRVINEQRGQNFNEFINHYRINKAKNLLIDPETRMFKLLKIAYDSGFNSLSVFNSAFKKHTSMSPSKFRASLSSNKINKE
jgi:ligand-binding sensor domain-containing protein/AraC-like DNA-binding protein